MAILNNMCLLCREKDSGLTKKKYFNFVCVAGLMIILDQLTKEMIQYNLPLYNNIVVIPGFFNITHIHNPGGAFGFLASQNSIFRDMFFIMFSILALCVLLYLFQKTPKTYPVLSLGFAFIFGGAAGNLIDRIRFGKVVDFIDLYIGDMHWPAFNIADSGITVGIFIFIYYMLFKELPD